jgi:hypothetical protein
VTYPAGAYIDVQPSRSGKPGMTTGISSALRKNRWSGRSVRVSRTAIAVPSTTEPTVVSTAKITLLRTASHHAGSLSSVW